MQTDDKVTIPNGPYFVEWPSGFKEFATIEDVDGEQWIVGRLSVFELRLAIKNNGKFTPLIPLSGIPIPEIVSLARIAKAFNELVAKYGHPAYHPEYAETVEQWVEKVVGGTGNDGRYP